MSANRKAAIYVRISRDQEGRKLGVQRQEKLCRELAERLGWTVAGVYPDNDISASSRSRKHRAQYRAMLVAVDAREIDAIVSYSTSRLTRRPLELEELIRLHERTGLTIKTVAAGQVDLSTASGRALARTLAAFDAREAEENSERSKAEREQRRQQGRWHGGTRPYGWENDGVTPRPAEQKLIEQGCEDVLAGRSVAAVARDWSAALGHHVRPNTVTDVLRNPRVAGMLPDERPALWPAIVGEDEWRGVVAVLSDPARRRNRGETRWLTGIAFCGRCANGATINGGIRRDGKHTYRCSAVKHLDRLAEPVDGFVTEVLLTYLTRERITPDDDRAADRGELAREAAGLRARLDALADDLDIDERTLARRSQALRARLDDVEARMTAAVGSSALLGLPLELAELRAWWDDPDLSGTERRRAVLRASGLTVTVYSPGRGTHPPDGKDRDELFGWVKETVKITPTETS